jgi:hypothetical protein
MKRNDASSINNRATKKSRTCSDMRISRPGLFDVICGRGRPYQEHLGNIRLHEIVSAHKPLYFNSKRHDKKGIASMIVNSIKNDETQPGRFLKRIDDENDMVWEDVSDKVACEKVGHILRFKYKNAQPPRTEAYSNESCASGTTGLNNQQASMQEVQSRPATGQHTLEALRNSMPLPRILLPVASNCERSTTQPLHASLNVQRSLLNAHHILNRATPRTAICAMPSGSFGTAEAPRNVSQTSPVNLLSEEQIFLLEAMIRTRRARTNSPDIAPAVQFPSSGR